MNQAKIVSKFGGSSMGDYQSMQRSASICIERGSSIIIVSATHGTTDKLIQIAELTSMGRKDEASKIVFDIKERHYSLLKDAGNLPQSLTQLESYFTELDLLVQNISLLKELTPKAYAHILSLGERMSSLIFRDVLSSMIPEKKVILLDARSVIKTNSEYGKAQPDLDLIRTNVHEKIRLGEDTLFVTQGFIASDQENNTTILGRGGSDYSAALFAEALNADMLEIWTDVAGIATTDPRLSNNARIIPELTYFEAGEMAQYGARILHPGTMSPAIRSFIPIFVGSSFEKDLPGTWIRPEVENKPNVRAITKRSSQALLTISTPRMFNASGFMSSLFEVFGKHNVSVDCVTTSEVSVAITVDQSTLFKEDFLSDLETVGLVEIESDFALVSLIGNELTQKPNLARIIFSSIDDVNIRMMGLGASPYNFNFLVRENDSQKVIESLHQKLIEEA